MSKTLLLADDSITIQKIVNLTFSGEGIDVVTVSNGDAAIRKAQELRPDVVLADIFMPGKNGYEVCEHIKNDSLLHSTPVILLVGAFEPFDPIEAERVHANGHLTKPFEIKVLISAVTSLISFEDQKLKLDANAESQLESSNKDESSKIEDWPQADSTESLLGPNTESDEPPSLLHEVPAIPRPMPLSIEDTSEHSETATRDLADIHRMGDVAANTSGLATTTMVQQHVEVSAAAFDDVDPLGLFSDNAFGDAKIGEPSAEARSLVVDIWESRSVSTPEMQFLGSSYPSSGHQIKNPANAVEVASPELTVRHSEALNEPQDTPVDPVPQLEVEHSEVRSEEDDRSVGTATPPEGVTTSNAEELIERIAHRVVEKMTREVVEKIAWEVVPDLAELLIKEQIEAHLKSRSL